VGSAGHVLQRDQRADADHPDVVDDVDHPPGDPAGNLIGHGLCSSMPPE